ncbi:cobalt-precorrin 5A hydrolase [Desulfurivibrio alkaliphilus]|uniref:Cobalamin (Vitamin B12) biosynthesis CbiG protein n=1 Tax=Desulfurivibrio alkaliphilus (strain DSM 19089 / UNIQEM U267 / AHT2) TaxID=589865 RepID=D6Z407_DESAT|nr:cobalt-precorrin 5A hydrolase [Desulfurivibrio alkaliphilus]ADH86282.1 cobalamin (vitamin B12) biosynthesis CbiG protein [Desulfurivibrio alkaliphilus AHT 2]
MKIGVLAMTAGGRKLAARLAAELEGAELVPVDGGIKATLAGAWSRYQGLVCIMAAGIVVRAVAPLLRDKYHDPGLVVVDECGQHAISLLSGHRGGGNELARRVALLCRGQAVITTASEVLGLPALDLWAEDRQLVPATPEVMTRAAARLVNRGTLRVYSEETADELPAGLEPVAEPGAAELIISIHDHWPPGTLLLHPRCLVLGIGCNRGTPATELATAIDELLAAHRLAPAAIHNLASIDLKQDEPGLLELAASRRWPLVFYSKDELNQVAGLKPAPAVLKATGAGGVSEPAALLSSGNQQLMIRKQKWRNVTLALARANFTLSAPAPAARNT